MQQDNKLTLQAFETLFEQLRYDDAKKFLDNQNQNVFYAELNISGFKNKLIYIVRAKNRLDAAQKLVNALDGHVKFQYSMRDCGADWRCNTIVGYSSKECQICNKEIEQFYVYKHYDSHTKTEIDKYLLQREWFKADHEINVL